jgi:hypothetical protein
LEEGWTAAGELVTERSDGSQVLLNVEGGKVAISGYAS